MKFRSLLILFVICTATLFSEEIESPKLKKFQEALVRGEHFQKLSEQLQSEGVPLVESIPGREKQLVTFLWWGDASTTSVQLNSDLNDEKNLGVLNRLQETSLWYKTYELEDNVRTTYCFIVNPDHTSSGFCQPDPYNPKQFALQQEIRYSVLELPKAPSQPWVEKRYRNGAGKVEAFKIKSSILENQRDIWVYTPPLYSIYRKPYRLLILFDGEAYMDLIPTPTILDNMIAKRVIPQIVTVLVSSIDQNSRNRELPCNPQFADFLAQELLPWVQDRYHVSKDPSQVIVGGSSYGGLAAMYAAFRYPHVFGNVLSQSGAFWWKPESDLQHSWLIEYVKAAPAKPINFYLDVGTLENQKYEGMPSMLSVNRTMLEILRGKGCQVHYAEFGGGHDYVCWRGTLSDGLEVLLKEANKPKLELSTTH